jgi:hypothetical protein
MVSHKRFLTRQFLYKLISISWFFHKAFYGKMIKTYCMLVTFSMSYKRFSQRIGIYVLHFFPTWDVWRIIQGDQATTVQKECWRTKYPITINSCRYSANWFEFQRAGASGTCRRRASREGSSCRDQRGLPTTCPALFLSRRIGEQTIIVWEKCWLALALHWQLWSDSFTLDGQVLHQVWSSAEDNGVPQPAVPAACHLFLKFVHLCELHAPPSPHPTPPPPPQCSSAQFEVPYYVLFWKCYLLHDLLILIFWDRWLGFWGTSCMTTLRTTDMLCLAVLKQRHVRYWVAVPIPCDLFLVAIT